MTFSFKTYLLRVACILTAISLFSCAKDFTEENTGTVAPKAQIRLQLPAGDAATRATEAGSNEENLIKNLYLFIFNSSGNKELGIYLDIPYSGSSTDVDMSLWNTENVITILNSAILSDLDMPRNIHIVANVVESKLASISNETQLKAVLTDLIAGEIETPGSSSPLLMHSVCPGHVYSSGVRATVSLVRNVSKIRLTVNTTDVQGSNQIVFAPGSELFITAANVADRSYIVSGNGSNPTGTQYIGYASKTLTNPAVSAGGKKFVMPAMYVNENVGDQVGSAITQTPTYLVVQIPFDAGGGTITDNYYKVLINEDNDLTVHRNTIYDITLNINALGGETEQTAPEVSATLNILQWNENTLVSDLTQTYISVEATTLQLAGGQFDFQYATNAEMAKRSITSSDASWLTATIDSDHNIKISASGTNYTAARTATLSIKVNDLTKVITVTQEAVAASDGSITLAPSPIYLSSAHPSRTVALTVTGSAPWSNFISTPAIATFTPVSGTGNATLNFTRGATANNADFRFMNLNTLTYADVKVCNLDLTSSVTELQIPGAGVTNETEIGIVALGGGATWAVQSKPAWMTVSNNGGDMLYSATAEPSETDRTGTIVLYHVDDPDLKVTIQVKQSAQYIMFPEFDYIVVRVKHSGTYTLDTQIEITGTGISGIDNKPVGWAMNSSQISDTGASYALYSVYYNNTTKQWLLLQWAGDSIGSGFSYMTSMVNLWNICYTGLNDLFPADRRYFNVDIYATWYDTTSTTTMNNTVVSIDLTLYKGGTMVPQNFDYVNTTGIKQLEETYTNFKVLTYQGYNTFRTSCTKLGTIVYDRYKNTATFNRAISGFSVNSSMDVNNASTDESQPATTREEYENRRR